MEDKELINEVETEDSIKEERKWCVYIHTSPSDKKYVGITSQKPPERRWRDGKAYTSSPYFWTAIQKYGWNNIQHIIVAENLTAQEACDMERKLITEYHTQDRKYGYNLTSGGDSTGGTHMSKESKRKISEAAKARLANSKNHPFYNKHHNEATKLKISKANRGKRLGVPLTEETKRKISAASKGHIVSEEAKKKMSEAKIGKYIGENNPMWGVSPKQRMDEDTYQMWLIHLSESSSGENNSRFGVVVSDETKQKISEALTGKMTQELNPFYGQHHTDETKEKLRQWNIENSPSAKPIYCIEFDMCYKSSAEAERITGIKAHNISCCCRRCNGQQSAGRHPVTGEKLHWNFITTEEYQKWLEQQEIIKNNILKGER